MSHFYRDQVLVSELSFREIRCEKPVVQTLGGTLVLLTDSPSFLALDPGGAARNVDMPAEEAQGMEGKLWFIVNAADAAEVITVRNDAAGTIVTLTQNEAAVLCVMGGVWRGYVMVA